MAQFSCPVDWISYIKRHQKGLLGSASVLDRRVFAIIIVIMLLTRLLICAVTQKNCTNALTRTHSHALTFLLGRYSFIQISQIVLDIPCKLKSNIMSRSTKMRLKKSSLDSLIPQRSERRLFLVTTKSFVCVCVCVFVALFFERFRNQSIQR